MIIFLHFTNEFEIRLNVNAADAIQIQFTLKEKSLNSEYIRVYTE